jgi:DNA-binding MarR family transcriptional regulator
MPEPDLTDVPAGVRLAALGRAAMRLLTEALKPTSLKPRHIAVLVELREGPRTQQALGELTGTDPTKLVGLLNDLEEMALIVRRRDPDDRRRHIVDISPCGRERLAEVDRLTAQADDALLAGLDAGQRAQLNALLTHVADHGGVVTTCESVAACAEDDADDDCG